MYGFFENYPSSSSGQSSCDQFWYDPRQLSDAKVTTEIRDTVSKFAKKFKPGEVIIINMYDGVL